MTGAAFRRAAAVALVVLSTGSSPLAAQRRIGELWLLGGAGHAASATREPIADPRVIPGGTLGGGAASFAFVLGPFSLGPETMVFRGSERRLWTLGGVARLARPRGAVRPHLVLGAAHYGWDFRHPGFTFPPDVNPSPFWTGDTDYFSASLGAGVTVFPGDGWFGFTAEARAHRNLSTDGFAGPRPLVTLLAGLRVTW